ncbi:MAG: hypothetical protein NVSMB14_14450 [Isosphaeraceae bacterium]
MSESLPPLEDLSLRESDPQILASLLVRIEDELHYYAGKEMPVELRIAWHAFLHGYFEGATSRKLGSKDYRRLRDMLPPLPATLEDVVGIVATGHDDEDLDW